MQKSIVTFRPQPNEFRELDTSYLGRPYHLIPVITRQTELMMQHFIETYLNQRYGGKFRLDSMTQGMNDQNMSETTFWLSLEDNILLGVSVNRRIAMRSLMHRYGSSEFISNDQGLGSETDTEYRTTQIICKKLCLAVGEHLLGLSLNKLQGIKPSRHNETLSNMVRKLPDRYFYKMRFNLVEEWGDFPTGGPILIYFGRNAFERVLIHAAKGDQSYKVLKRELDNTNIEDRINIKLDTQIASINMQLNEVLSLKKGQVIPLHSPPENGIVSIQNQAVFEVKIHEEKQKIYISQFKELE